MRSNQHVPADVRKFCEFGGMVCPASNQLEMTTMPMDRSKYPPNWDEIATRIKTQAAWKCERCGKQCRWPDEQFERHPDDVKVNPEAGAAVFEAACEKFGHERCRHDRYSQKGGAPDFPVLTKDGRIASSLAMSQTLTQLEAVSVDFVFVDPSILSDARAWLKENLVEIITPKEGANDE